MTFKSLMLHTVFANSLLVWNAKNYLYNYHATNSHLKLSLDHSFISFISELQMICNYKPQLYWISHKYTHKHQIKQNKMASTQFFVFIFQITCKVNVIQSQMVKYMHCKKISRVYQRAHLHHIAQSIHMYKTQLVI